MSDFTTSSRSGAVLDPRKRVAYTLGMVLGADDFEQEQFHLRARDDAAVRALGGYGTVSGLAVSFADGQVEVAPGLAVDPEGRLVCVPSAQCADLQQWLDGHRDELVGSLPDESPPSGTAIHVVLCHRECPTDTVPLPSETCRSAADSTAPSRVLDAFELRLTTVPPLPGGELTSGALADVLTVLVDGADSPPGTPELEEVRDGIVDWATASRSELPANACLAGPALNCGASGSVPSSGVLLARLDLELAEDVDGRVVLASEPVTDDAERPVLLSQRFLQEWLTRLTLRPTGVDDHNLLGNLDVGDVHEQYLPADGSRPLTGALDAGANRLTNLAPSGADADAAMRRDEVVGGDLRDGGAGPARLAQLQGTTLRVSGSEAPDEGDVLTFRGGAWRPQPAPSGGGGGPEPPRVHLPFVTIERVGSDGDLGTSFVLWFNLAAVDRAVTLADLVLEEHLVVLSERCEREELVVERLDPRRLRLKRLECNLWQLQVRSDDRVGSFLRFVFITERLETSDGRGVVEHAEELGIAWDGGDEEGLVTKFVLNPASGRPLSEALQEADAPSTPAGGSQIATRP